MGKSGGQGSQVVLLLVLLGILGGAGAWNYQRNLKLEEAEPRPYRSYSMEDLDSLRAAYQAEVDAHTARHRAATAGTVRIREGGLLGDQVHEFERVQRISSGKRAIATEYAKNQVQLDAVQAEISRRAAEANGWQVLLRRATTLP